MQTFLMTSPVSAITTRVRLHQTMMTPNDRPLRSSVPLLPRCLHSDRGGGQSSIQTILALSVVSVASTHL